MAKRLKFRRPKGVPKNYIQQIHKNLNQKGFAITYIKVNDVLDGKYADVELVKTVLEEMYNVRDQHQANLKEIAALRKSIKKA